MGRGWVNAIREAAGAKKGKLFTKISKEITVAVKMGGASPEGNPRLRASLIEARKNSMPKDTVDRAIKRGSGAGDEANFDEVVYEGYGPNGVAVIVEALTDNRNRTVQELRAAFHRGGGNLGETGAVGWMFDRMGLVVAKAPSSAVDAEETAIVCGADAVEEFGPGEWMFWTAFSDLDAVSKALEAASWELSKVEISYRPKNPMELDADAQKSLQEFVSLVEDSDDVKRVHLSV